MRWLLWIILVVFATASSADSVPKSVVAKVNRDAQKYIDEVTVLILGFGSDGAIDRVGLENVVAQARAEVRAMAFRRLQGADLNGDGAISGPEVQVTAAAASAVSRGRMIVHFGHADADGDGAVSAAELQTYANGAALEAFSADKAQGVYAVMGFDGDGDGLVTVPEVAAAVSALALEQRNPREIQNQLHIQGNDHGGNQDGQPDQPARRDQRPHLDAVSGEHDQRHHGEAQL